jgi:hypothetical protein
VAIHARTEEILAVTNFDADSIAGNSSTVCSNLSTGTVYLYSHLSKIERNHSRVLFL